MKEKKETLAPGSVIAKQLRFYRMTKQELAGQMGITKNQVEKLIAGEARLTRNVAVKLEKALNLPADFWMNLEEVYQQNKDEE